MKAKLLEQAQGWRNYISAYLRRAEDRESGLALIRAGD